VDIHQVPLPSLEVEAAVDGHKGDPLEVVVTLAGPQVVAHQVVLVVDIQADHQVVQVGDLVIPQEVVEAAEDGHREVPPVETTLGGPQVAHPVVQVVDIPQVAHLEVTPDGQQVAPVVDLDIPQEEVEAAVVGNKEEAAEVAAVVEAATAVGNNKEVVPTPTAAVAVAVEVVGNNQIQIVGEPNLK